MTSVKARVVDFEGEHQEKAWNLEKSGDDFGRRSKNCWDKRADMDCGESRVGYKPRMWANSKNTFFVKNYYGILNSSGI